MSTRSDVPAGELCDVRHLHPARIAELRRDLISPDATAALAETFRLLGDPTRVRMLDALSRGELCVCDLASVIGLSESAVSHQLRSLRTLRLVRPRRDGRMVYYALDDRHILALFRQGLRHVQEPDHHGAGRTEGAGRRASEHGRTAPRSSTRLPATGTGARGRAR